MAFQSQARVTSQARVWIARVAWGGVGAPVWGRLVVRGVGRKLDQDNSAACVRERFGRGRQESLDCASLRRDDGRADPLLQEGITRREGAGAVDFAGVKVAGLRFPRG